MIDRVKGAIVFVCDACDDTLECDIGTSMPQAQAQRRDAGWVCRQVNDAWQDYCPACRDVDA